MIPALTIDDMEKELCAIEETLATFKARFNELKTANRAEWNWMTVKEAQAKIGCSAAHIYNMADKGKLKSTRQFGKLLVQIKE